MNNQNCKVIVVHQDDEFRQLLCSLLEASRLFRLADHHANYDEVLRFTDVDGPDIIVMGIHCSESKTMDTIRECKSRFPHAGIVVIADSDDERAVFERLHAGGDICILRDEIMGNFVQCLYGLMCNERTALPSMANKIVRSFHVSALTPREIEVFNLITFGNSYSQIASQLKISKETSKTHIRNIYRKLEVRKKSDAIKKICDDATIPMTWTVQESGSLLTQHEVEVLNLIVQGNSYTQIAGRLDMLKETAKTHIRRIYRKLDVRSKCELIQRAFGDNKFTTTVEKPTLLPFLKEETKNRSIKATADLVAPY